MGNHKQYAFFLAGREELGRVGSNAVKMSYTWEHQRFVASPQKICNYVWKRCSAAGLHKDRYFRKDSRAISPRSAVVVGSLLCSWCLTWSALAVEPAEMLADPTLEARARAVSQQLRCVVCQNQSIDESNAELARDMRLLVRERIKVGDGNEDVIRFLIDRYGDFVTLLPPFRPSTWLLWLSPVLFLLIAVGIAQRLLLRRSRVARDPPPPSVPPPLSDDERRRLCALMQKNGGYE